jgi:hypothetical protein
MPQNWESRIREKLERIQTLGKGWNRLKTGAKRLSLKGAYWSAVFVVGFAVAGGIMNATGVPVFQGAEAVGILQGVAIVFGNIIYLVLVVAPGFFLAIAAWIMGTVIEYPWGAFWQTGDASGEGGYVNVTAVITGWKLVRDLCNIFFSIILVIIALATVLNIEAYSWKQLLNKFVLYAILINFSKSIAGVFTDVATIIMATFGSSFAGNFAIGILGAFGLPEATGLVTGDELENVEESSASAIFFSYIAAAFMVQATLVVVTVSTVALILRIFMLWFLIVISPLAYVSRILPITARYSSRWWEMFGRWVTAGPLIVFFLWLSLTMVLGGNPVTDNLTGDVSEIEQRAAASGTPAPPNPAARSGAAAASTNVLANFMISFLLMTAGGYIIKEMAKEGGNILGQVEGLASGAAKSLMEKGGQVVGSLGTRLGGAEAPAGAGAFTRAAYGAARGLGQTATFAGATVLQPLTFAKSVASNIQASSQERQRRFRNTMQQKANTLQEQNVVGQGFFGGAAGLLQKSMGVTMGAGMEDGKHVFDQYISGTGAARMARQFGKFASGRYGEYRQLVADKTAAQQELDRRRAAYGSEDQASDAAAEYDRLGQQAGQALEAAAAIQDAAQQNTVDINLDDADIQAVITGEVESLQEQSATAAAAGDMETAGGLAAQANALQDMLDTGGISNMAALSRAAGGMNRANVANGLAGVFNNQAAAARGQRLGIRDQLAATGYGFDDAGNITQVGNQFATEADIAAQQAEYNDIARREGLMMYELAALEPGVSYEGRMATQSLVAEELRKLQDVKNTDELRGYFTRAIRERNHYMAEAVMQRITQNGDENEMIQQWMSEYLSDAEQGRVLDGAELEQYKLPPDRGVDANGQPIRWTVRDLIRTDGLGLEFFRNRIFKDELGMDENQSIRVANDLTYIGEAAGHLGIGRKYSFRGGQWNILSEQDRAATIAGEKIKASPNDFLQWNRLAWGYEDRNRDFHLSPHGLTILRNNAAALASDRLWERFNANAKRYLSRPAVRQQLLDAGVDDPEFQRKLQEYWDNTASRLDAEAAQVRRAVQRIT